MTDVSVTFTEEELVFLVRLLGNHIVGGGYSTPDFTTVNKLFNAAEARGYTDFPALEGVTHDNPCGYDWEVLNLNLDINPWDDVLSVLRDE